MFDFFMWIFTFSLLAIFILIPTWLVKKFRKKETKRTVSCLKTALIIMVTSFFIAIFVAPSSNSDSNDINKTGDKVVDKNDNVVECQHEYIVVEETTATCTDRGQITKKCNKCEKT